MILWNPRLAANIAEQRFAAAHRTSPTFTGRLRCARGRTANTATRDYELEPLVMNKGAAFYAFVPVAKGRGNGIANRISGGGLLLRLRRYPSAYRRVAGGS